ncbi:MAG: hypothetical protein VX278_10235 [Myxococcota bacterium]|nr:hypothetical protein [Myxococcota bacterium]
MSDLESSSIQYLLEIERGNEKVLQAEIKEKKEELLRCQGKILAYEELLKNSARKTSSSNTGGIDESEQDKSSELKEEKKERAPRTTKKEMERRRQMVVRAFVENGNLSAKDLQPLVETLLGYEMEPHHLRAVLRKFSKDFVQKNDHGIWGLTDQSKEAYASLAEEESSQDDDPSPTV